MHGVGLLLQRAGLLLPSVQAPTGHLRGTSKPVETSKSCLEASLFEASEGAAAEEAPPVKPENVSEEDNAAGDRLKNQGNELMREVRV